MNDHEQKILKIEDLPVTSADNVDIRKPDVALTCEEFEQHLLALEHMTDIDGMAFVILTDHIRTCLRGPDHQQFLDDFVERIKRERQQ